MLHQCQVVPFEATGKLAASMIKGPALKVYPGAPRDLRHEPGRHQ